MLSLPRHGQAEQVPLPPRSLGAGDHFVTLTPSSADRRQVLVHRPHRAGPLADGGRDPLERTVPDIADGEDTRDGGLEGQGIARRERRAGDDRVGERTIGEDEPRGVEREGVAQPRRCRLRADEAEQTQACNLSSFPGRVVLERHPLEMALAADRPDLGGRQELDPRPRSARPDTATSASTGRPRESRSTPGHPAARGRSRLDQPSCRRPRRGRRGRSRSAPPDQWRRSTRRRLRGVRAVDGQPLVARARRDDHGAGRDLAAIGELDDVETPGRLEGPRPRTER